MHELVRTALAAADAAVAVHRSHTGRAVLEGASEKARADYVSQADLDAQAAALDVIRARFPGHGILAEEDPAPLAERLQRGEGRPLWIVDPLDGTANFLHGHPQHCASVAVAVDGVVQAGAVSAAATGERWWAARGEGAYRNGRRVSVAPPRRLRDAMVGTGFPFKAIADLPDFLDQLGRVLKSSAGVRRAGSAALDLCFLAQGSLDAFWEVTLMPWDVAAGWLVVEEAGGSVTRMGGEPMSLEAGSVLGASSPALLEELRTALG